MQLRRFREQAKRAATGTAFYADRFASCDPLPATMSWDEIAQLPLTSKTALRDDPDAFIHCDAPPILRSTIAGTTGHPTQVSFSAREHAAGTDGRAAPSPIGSILRS